MHHRNSKLFFHPAKFDNFRDEKISDYKTQRLKDFIHLNLGEKPGFPKTILYHWFFHMYLSPFHITTICHVPSRSLKCIRLDSHLDELQPCAGIHTAHSRLEYYSLLVPTREGSIRKGFGSPFLPR